MAYSGELDYIDPYDDVSDQFQVDGNSGGRANNLFTMPELPDADQPYTSADGIRLNKLNQSLAQVRGHVDDGTLDPFDADALQKQLIAARQPLLMRQKQHQELAEQQQRLSLLNANAQAQALDHQDAVFRARGFQDRVSTYTDPWTGKTVHMYEQSPNKWAQISFPQDDGGGSPPSMPAQDENQDTQEEEDTQEAPPVAESQGSSEVTKPADGSPAKDDPRAIWRFAMGREPTQEEIDSGAVDAYAARANTPEAVAQREAWRKEGTLASAEDLTKKPHTMTIEQGGTKEVVQYGADGKIVSRQKFDDKGRPIVEQAEPKLGAGVLHPAERDIIRHQAEQMFRNMRPGPARDRAIANQMHLMESNILRARQHEADQQARAAQAEARAAATERNAKLKKEIADLHDLHKNLPSVAQMTKDAESSVLSENPSFRAMKREDRNSDEDFQNKLQKEIERRKDETAIKARKIEIELEKKTKEHGQTESGIHGDDAGKSAAPKQPDQKPKDEKPKVVSVKDLKAAAEAEQARRAAAAKQADANKAPAPPKPPGVMPFVPLS